MILHEKINRLAAVTSQAHQPRFLRLYATLLLALGLVYWTSVTIGGSSNDNTAAAAALSAVTSPATAHPKYAFATFMSHNDAVPDDAADVDDDEDGYFVYIQQLAYKLLHDPATRSDPPLPFLVLVTDEVSQRKRDRFAAYGAIVVPVEPLRFAWLKPTLPRWRDVMSKLRLFQLTEYDKICFLDADHLVVARLDGVFDDPAANLTANRRRAHPDAVKTDEAPQPDAYLFAGRPEYPASMDHAWPPEEGDALNAGFFVFRPSEEIFRYYLSLVRENPRFDPGFPEQNLLNYAHRRGPGGNMPWTTLSYYWNMNWANWNDYERGVRSFHARYHLDDGQFDWGLRADPKLRRLWRQQRWLAKGYFIGKGIDLPSFRHHPPTEDESLQEAKKANRTSASMSS